MNYLQYRAFLIIGMLSGTLPLIMIFVWQSIASGNQLGTFSTNDLALYFLSAFFVQQATFAWVVWALTDHIRYGSLTYRLLQPLNPYWRYIADNLGEKAIRLPFALLPMLLYILLAYPGTITFVNVLSFVVALLMAWLIRFESQYCFGLLSFWTDKATALDNLWYTLFIVFSGLLAPIDFFPPLVGEVLRYLPFAYIIDFPVRTLLSSNISVDLAAGFGIQLFWALFFVVLRIILWRFGLRKYGAVGA
jgi:ABC-2 type transport system permease protein